MQLINIADIKDPKTGKTAREENSALQHLYGVGDLVEVVPWDGDCEYAGMRLYIIGCVRDCDETPLYVLGSKGMNLWQEGFVNPLTSYNFNSFSGFSESSLKLINSNQ